MTGMNAAWVSTLAPIDWDADPCRHCGMSNWNCLDGINRPSGVPCCGWCGIVDVHGIAEQIAAERARDGETP